MAFYAEVSLSRIIASFIFISISFCVNAERYSVDKVISGDFTYEGPETLPEAPVSLSEEGGDRLQENPTEKVEAPKSLSQIVPEKEISIFEQKYIESEQAEGAKILKGLTSGGSSRPYDATEVNAVDFVDADSDDIEKYGGTPREGKVPYYITVDEYGRPRNVSYDPDAAKAALNKQKDTKLDYTQASVFERPVNNGKSLSDLPSSADPVAVAILSSGKYEAQPDYFQSFSESCCDKLPNKETPALLPGKYLYFDITQASLPYRFKEGDSRYVLLKLPNESKQNFPLRVRSFIRKHAQKSIDHGVFFPQLITLDKDRKPVRIFAGPLLKYHEETWTNHGFLEGVFEIDRSEAKDERYVLINTTKDALKQSSFVENDDGEINIKHMGIGTFEVEVLVGFGA